MYSSCLRISKGPIIGGYLKRIKSYYQLKRLGWMLFKTYCVSSSLNVEQNNGICIKKIDSFGQYLNKLLLLDL